MRKRLLATLCVLTLALVLILPAFATVSSETTRISYAGNDSTTVFAYTFRIFADADLLVIVRDANGDETTQTLTTHYSVSDAGEDAGGEVTMVTAPASTETLVIMRDAALTQATDYIPGGKFPAESHEAALDKLTILVQQLEEKLDRALLLKKTSSLSELDLPNATASNLLGWNDSGDGIANYSSTTVETPNLDYMGNYSDSLATAISTIGSTPTTLMIHKEITLTASAIIPSTLNLMFLREGKITLGNYDLTFTYAPVSSSYGQIFNYSGTGLVKGTILADKVPDTWWGTDHTGTDDSTAALQDALNYVAQSDEVELYSPPGEVLYTKLYLHYDASNNADWPTGAYRRGRISIRGAGFMDRQNMTNSDYVGTLWRSTDATGPGIHCDGSTNIQRQVNIRDMSFKATNTTSVIHLERVRNWSEVSNVFVYQVGTGTGIDWEYPIFARMKDVFILGNGTGASHTGLHWWNDSGDNGGFGSLENVTAHEFTRGIVFGHETQAAGGTMSNVRAVNIEGNTCDTGIIIGHKVVGSEFDVSIEDCVTGLYIINWATRNTFSGQVYNSDIGAILGSTDLSLAFTSGGTYEIRVDDTITGATSNATALVHRIMVTSGTWAGGDAAGTLWLSSQVGNFQAENLNVGGDLNEATIAADSSAITNCRYKDITFDNFHVETDARTDYGTRVYTTADSTKTSGVAVKHYEYEDTGNAVAGDVGLWLEAQNHTALYILAPYFLNASTDIGNLAYADFVHAADEVVYVRSGLYKVHPIATLANEATPTVLDDNVVLTGGTTTITDFDDGVTGQMLTVIAEHSLDITDGTNIFLSGSANWSMTATDTLTLICKADNKWYEVSRGDNGA